MMQQQVSINICGDFYIDPSLNEECYFDDGIISLFQETDLNIINLESPITENISTGIIKSGPHLHQAEGSLTQLKKLNAGLVTLSNNHIMDYGSGGLQSTLIACQKESIRTVGAGLSIDEARQPFTIEAQGKKIAVLNFAEHEFSIATSIKPGANPFDIVESSRQIIAAKQKNAFVIVIIHGGHEHYSLPSPRMVAQYRFLAEMGASVIVGHHTHCLSGFEIHNHVPIFYSLGNFFFTREFESESANLGLVLNLKLTEPDNITWDLVPIRKQNTRHFLSRLTAEESQIVLGEIKNYNNIIADESLLLENWNRFIDQNIDETLFVFSPINMIRNKKIKRALKRIGIGRLFINKSHYKKMFSYMNCESLLDVSLSSIKKFLKIQK